MRLGSIFYLIPEITIIIFLSFLVITFTFLRQKHFKVSNFDSSYFPNLNYGVWAVLTLLSVVYSTMLFFNEKSFKLTYGIYSTPLIYSIKFVLSLLFILFSLYLLSTINKYNNFEFYISLFFSYINLNFILMSSSLVNLFIFIEMFSLSVYYLACSSKGSIRNVEAAIKYFILGSSASSFFLLGVFLVYYSTGTLNIYDFSMLFTNNSSIEKDNILLIGLLLLVASLLFKMGSSFFFFWMIDVYSGLSFTIFLFLNIFSKITYLAVVFNLLYFIGLPSLEIFTKYFLITSLGLGFFGSVLQIKLKRLLVFLSIYNISFFALTLWESFLDNQALFIFFSFLYLLNSFVLMALFSSLKDWRTNKTVTSIYELASIHKQNPYLSSILITFLLISSGLPPTMFFASKFIIFFVTSQSIGLPILLFFLIFSSLNFFIYLRLIKIILTPTPKHTLFLKPINFTISLVSTVALTLNFYAIIFLDKLFFFIQFQLLG